ncbi:MAG: lysophospholipid acyltransferase family protein [Planctomycetota bacterium]
MPKALGLPASIRGAGGLGRAFGGLPFNKARVARATERLEVALPALGMPGLDEPARRDLVLQSYAHLAKLAIEISALPRTLTPDTWYDLVDLSRCDAALVPLLRREPAVLITGHTGNWEVLAATLGVLGFPMTALYRPLDVRPLDRWLRETRSKQGINLLDKFGAADHLPQLMDTREPVAFVADQNAGDKGLFVPFLGRLASSYKTIGLLTHQYGARVICGQSRRIHRPRSHPKGPLGYTLDIIDVFGPDDYQHQPDPVFYITARYRRAIERMVARCPEQYLWMHRMWKSRPLHERRGKPFPPRLREKLEALPWMTEPELNALIERSDRDAATLNRLGVERLP